jgi:hypothetical protein
VRTAELKLSVIADGVEAPTRNAHSKSHSNSLIRLPKSALVGNCRQHLGG